MSVRRIVSLVSVLAAFGLLVAPASRAEFAIPGFELVHTVPVETPLATPDLREKIFKNMSSRAAETLKEDLEGRGPVRLSEVEAEQKEMLKIVRRLVDEGQIVLAGGGDEQFV